MRTLEERLAARAVRQDGCLLWTGCLNGSGYGMIRVGGRSGRAVYVHRIAYELSVGPIPEGFQVDHSCGVRRCLEPSHLEAVPQRENMARSGTPWARFARGRCQRDHDVTLPGAVYTTPDGRGQCRACRQMRRKRANA